MKNGIDLIAEERQRQIEEEGWTPEHDDQHTNNELAFAAACYAASPLAIYKHLGISSEETGANGHSFVELWPWSFEWDKRDKHGRIKQLKIAGALIAAEIDRLNRICHNSNPESPTSQDG
jgi:hypothetical protein